MQMHAKYQITCSFYGGKIATKEMYIGTPADLQKTIAATWSQIPYEVKVGETTIDVYKKGSLSRLASFELTPLITKDLPDHF